MKLNCINQLNADSRLEDQWDRLWEASTESLPTYRYEATRQFLLAFESETPIELAYVQEDDDEIAATIATIKKSSYRFFPTRQFLVNPWAQCGGLLVRHDASPDVVHLLATHLASANTSFFDFQWVNDSDESWARMCSALKSAGCIFYCEPQFEVGLIHLAEDFDDYWSTLSKNHRKDLKRSEKRLSELGKITYARYREFDQEPIQPLLEQAFEIEQRGWKGEQGSSVLSVDGAFDYYLETAKLLASAGMFEIQFLLLDGKPIAFEYGYTAKGTYFSHKVSYDPDYRKFGPGQLLMLHQLRAFSSDEAIKRIDTMGILSAATAKWCNDSYQRSRYLVSTRSFTSKCIVRGLGMAKAIKRTGSDPPEFKFKPRPMPLGIELDFSCPSNSRVLQNSKDS